MPLCDKQNKRAQPPQNGAPFRSLKIMRKQKSFFEENAVRHSNKENPKVDAGWSSQRPSKARSINRETGLQDNAKQKLTRGGAAKDRAKRGR
jgi:hypothetical protein